MKARRVMRGHPFTVQPTPLVGRREEIDELTRLLEDAETRLITLTGPGGIGKTRIALAAAQRCESQFQDGVYFVALAAVRDAKLVVPSIAQALDIREAADLAPRDGVFNFLKDQQTLLVLDNFEQLRPAATDIAELLAECAHLNVLITSRARLRIRGEHEFVVSPLELPAESSTDLGSIQSNAAVQLFLQRAHDVVPDLQLTESNAVAIADICRRLDGLPLAIELAAARIKVLPPEAMLARMTRRLPMLTDGPHDLPDRLRTMRNAIDWSYDLLSQEEQALFRRLCVFSGGFSLHEASAINDPEPVDPSARPDGSIFSMIELLSSLVDNSLVIQGEIHGEPRFSMLETIQEFGREELARAGDADAAFTAHAEFFTTFAEAALVRLRGAERSSWLDRLEQTHDNLRSALDWAIEREHTDLAVRLAGALWQFWWWRAHLAEGRTRLERVAALPEAHTQGAAYARVLTGCGALSETQGDYSASERYHAEAVAAWQAIDDSRGLAVSLLFRWLVAFNADDLTRMEAFSSESLRIFREVRDPWGTAVSLMEKGVMAMRSQENDEGVRVLEESIAVFSSINDQWGIAISKGVLGNVKSNLGDYVAAEALLKESLSALVVLDDLWGVATILPAIARAAAEQGDLERAVRISGSINKLHQTMGGPLKVPFRERYERNLMLAKAKLGPERLERYLQEGGSLTPAEAVAAAFRSSTKSDPAAGGEGAAFDALAIPLSPREREVLRMVPGRTAKEIGQALFIAESTVRTHIESILNKLGLRNQKELIAFVYEHKLI